MSMSIIKPNNPVFIKIVNGPLSKIVNVIVPNQSLKWKSTVEPIPMPNIFIFWEDSENSLTKALFERVLYPKEVSLLGFKIPLILSVLKMSIDIELVKTTIKPIIRCLTFILS